MCDKVAYEEFISKQLNHLVGLNMCDKVAYEEFISKQLNPLLV